MANQIQAGTIMVRQLASLRSLGIESEPYSGSWQSLGVLESSGLDRKIRAAGWKLFFMASELRAAVPDWGGQKTLRRGVKRLLAQTRAQHFNCMELTHILRKRFLGIPYVSIAAHSRHIQLGSQIQSVERSNSARKMALTLPADQSRSINSTSSVGDGNELGASRNEMGQINRLCQGKLGQAYGR